MFMIEVPMITMIVKDTIIILVSIMVYLEW